MSPLEIKENAVIYARFSSSGQREESIEGQLRECRAYAEKNNLRVVAEYCDYAISGTSDKRPEFQRMIRDSAKGQFAVVITWKNDRFARNRYDSAMYKYKLRQNGVRLLYAKEVIPEGPEGIILESIMEGYAEYYSANLSQNVKRGYYDSALKLQTLGQTVLGLKRGADGKFEIDPATAPIVKRIFTEYAAGKSAKEIYHALNAEGYRTSRGGLYNKNSLRRILQNEKYCGVYEYADIRVEDGIPAIVSKELFQKVQGIVNLHHVQPAAKKIEGGFLLTGKLFCGHCGEAMTADGGTGKSGRVYHYYICNKRRLGKCEKKRVPKDWIENVVVDELVKIAMNDDIVNEFADRFMIWQEKEKGQAELRSLEERLKKIEAAIKNTMSLIDSGLITDSLKAHLVELEREKIDVERGIAEETLKTPNLSRKQVIMFLTQFRKFNKEDVAWRIYLVETFINKVYLYDDGRLRFVLNYGGDNNAVCLQLVDDAAEYGEELCSNFAPPVAPEPGDSLIESDKEAPGFSLCFLADFHCIRILLTKKAEISLFYSNSLFWNLRFDFDMEKWEKECTKEAVCGIMRKKTLPRAVRTRCSLPSDVQRPLAGKRIPYD